VNYADQTVFLIDDDPAVRRSLTTLVEVVFPKVKAFESASAFLKDYSTDMPGCLVLDVAMPDMNGLELHRKLLNEKIDLPVVFITGHGNVQMAVGAMQSGAVNFLEKPFHEQELWDSIRKALELDLQSRRRKARRQKVDERLSLLSDGERSVLNMILDGKLNKEIASELGLSNRTIEDRRARLMKKMGASSIVQLVQIAMTH
jgi:two-component system, LuxR family, response regulator FixJ